MISAKATAKLELFFELAKFNLPKSGKSYKFGVLSLLIAE